MKISPEFQFNLAFWPITILFALIFVPISFGLVMIAAILWPISRRSMYFVDNFVNNMVDTFVEWRFNLPIIKNAYDQIHFFDYIRGN